MRGAVVHWRRGDFCPRRLERTQRFGIARVFEPSRIAGVKKQSGGQIECLLGAQSDDDLLSVATHSARSANVLCYLPDRIANGERAAVPFQRCETTTR
jgi:hypothetical protein